MDKNYGREREQDLWGEMRIYLVWSRIEQKRKGEL